jgi:hypothetical protein
MDFRPSSFSFQSNLYRRLLYLVCVVFVVISPSSNTTAQVNTVPKTATEKFKNVSVLSDMPADQMGKVMNMMSASLGVNCSYCHEGTNFAKEGVGHKEAARKMISMTLGLNKEFFDGKTDEIIAGHIRAIGGKQKLDLIKSRHVIAKRIEPNGVSEPEELWQTANGLTRMVTQYGSVAVVEGFDGSQAWKRANENGIELKPDEAEQIKLEAVIAFGSAIPSAYSELAFQSADRIDDRDVYVLSGLNRLKMQELLSFDVQSGLLRRRVSSVPTLLGAFEYQVDYEKYQDIGGVLQPTKIQFAVPNITWTREVSNIEMNLEIDESIFRLR